MAVLCLLIFGMVIVQSCKSQKDAQQMSREEKDKQIETMEVKKVESKPMTLNQDKINNIRLERTKESLLGTWNWYKTDCCARLPKTTMAKDVKESKSLSFSDNTQTYFENGEITSSVPFELGYAFNDDRVTLKSGEFKTAILHIKGDTLVLDYGYMDLAIDYYIKGTGK